MVGTVSATRTRSNFKNYLMIFFTKFKLLYFSKSLSGFMILQDSSADDVTLADKTAEKLYNNFLTFLLKKVLSKLKNLRVAVKSYLLT